MESNRLERDASSPTEFTVVALADTPSGVGVFFLPRARSSLPSRRLSLPTYSLSLSLSGCESDSLQRLETSWPSLASSAI